MPTTRPAPSGRPQKSVVFRVEVPAGPGGTPAAQDVRFEKHASSVTLTPNSGQESWQGLTPDAQVTATGEPVWTFSANLIQALHDPDSLSRFLLKHYGRQATVTYYPHDDVNWGLRTTLILPAPNIGGGPTVNESTITAQCTKPEEVTTAVSTLTP